MKRAVVLVYDAEHHDAPLVVCAGEGDMAQRIERAALDSGVALVRDASLAWALADVLPGEPIPEALYEAVAAILHEIAPSSSRGAEGR